MKFVRTFAMYYIECERYLLRYTMSMAGTVEIFTAYVECLIRFIVNPPSDQWNVQNTSHAMFKTILEKLMTSKAFMLSDIVGWVRVDRLITALDEGRAPYHNAVQPNADAAAIDVDSDDDEY